MLFHQGSQRTYVTKRIKYILRLNRIENEKNFVNTFGDYKTKRALLGKVDLISRNHDSKTFFITALCTDYICLSVKNQLITQCSFTQTNRVWS